METTFWIFVNIGLVFSIMMTIYGFYRWEFELVLSFPIFAFISFVVYFGMESYSSDNTTGVVLSKEKLEVLDMDLIDDKMRFDYRDPDTGEAKTIKFDSIADFHKYQKGGELTKVKSVKYLNFGSDRYYSEIIINVED